MTEFLELLRAVNVALSIGAFGALLIRINDNWATLSRGRKITLIGLTGFPGVAALGSALKYVNHVEPDISVALVTILCLLILLGTWMTRGESLISHRH